MTEPMSRESVLAVLDEYIEHFTGYRPLTDDPRLQECIRTRAAVAALYERCEALERALRDVGQILLDRGVKLPRELRLRASKLLTGTEPSDAEGGG
jgi:hypothetical protein